MAGISDELMEELVHKDFLLDYKNLAILSEMLWYSPSKDAYIQRNKNFDGSIFDRDSPLFKSIVDKCTLAFLYITLNLSHINQFEGATDSVETDIKDNFEESKAFLSFLKGKNLSSFYSFLLNCVMLLLMALSTF